MIRDFFGEFSSLLLSDGSHYAPVFDFTAVRRLLMHGFLVSLQLDGSHTVLSKVVVIRLLNIYLFMLVSILTAIIRTAFRVLFVIRVSDFSHVRSCLYCLLKHDNIAVD